MSGKKLEKVAVTVSMDGIKVYNMATKDIRTDLPIYRYDALTYLYNTIILSIIVQ